MAGRASTSSSFNNQWTYDVFINFRGEDTRHCFTGHLYNALTQKSIRTFIDDEELSKGDEITPTLLRAIEESRMAIIVFSDNYASSTFCLHELVKILQCITGKGRLVWPIFYDVLPSDVRHQKGKYEEALAMHKNNFKADEKMIQGWKFALHEAANLSGLHFTPRHGQYEYKFIERIVEEISSKINRVPLHVAKYPVGLDSRVQKINSLLRLGSNEEVNMVGICGIGGMGKTTLARAVYNSIADNFEGLCFLHDIEGNSRKFGLEHVQERMLSRTVGVNIKIDDVNEGAPIIKRRLGQKKVLLILDDVVKQEQLEKLADGCDWFGCGSRIIITTRDKKLLLRHGVEKTYEMDGFNDKESLELLSWNAFRNKKVDSCYENVLNRVLHYVQGLPLALEVIGSHLFDMNINEWESALDVYKRIPNEDIQQILKVSYDGLKEVEKEIFLDIACFFQGSELKYVKDMVENVHGFDPYYGIKVLVDKCLIKIENNHIKMHNLIQDTGREIVRQESANEPGKRSRLWFNDDIIHVLEENTGTNEVSIMIQNNLSECIEINWDGEAFKNMKNLKILIFEKARFSEGPKYLPNSLRVLKWPGYPSSWLPLHFCPKNLVAFNLAHSCLISLETVKMCKNLNVLNLRGCHYITKIPNLSDLPNLKELRFNSCRNLIDVDDSVGYLEKLEVLNAGQCAQLKTFPRCIKLPSLKVLVLYKCSSLTNFPEIQCKMKISNLYLLGTCIEKLPWSICNLTQLKELTIRQHRGVIELPRSIFLLPDLEVIHAERCGKLVSDKTKEEPEDQDNLKHPVSKGLRVNLENCNISDEVLGNYLTWFNNVKYLDLSGNNFTILPACIEECHFLLKLVLRGCKHLREVEGIPPNIKHLDATDCISLNSASRNFLLSEELLGDVVITENFFNPETYFCVPGGSIPKWLDHCSKGASISFWFRHHFPTLCLCALFKPKSHVLGSRFISYDINAMLFINGKEVHQRNLWNMGEPNDGHIVVYDLKADHFRPYYVKQLCQAREWNHVMVIYNFCNSQLVPKRSGIFVINQRDMKDIRFPHPYPSLDTMSGDQECDSLETTVTSSDDEGNSYHTGGDEEDGPSQSGLSLMEKVASRHRKRMLMEDDDSAPSSIAFRCTKRGRTNCSINQHENDADTTEIKSADASETIGMQGMSILKGDGNGEEEGE